MTKRKSPDLAPEQQSLNDVLEEFRQLDAAGPGQNAAIFSAGARAEHVDSGLSQLIC